MSADGDGRDVRYGFCARAADRAGFEVGGVMSVISRRFGQLDFFNRPLTGLGWNAQTDSLLVHGHIQTKIWGGPSKLKRWSPARLGHS
jgi:hypothetical protein